MVNGGHTGLLLGKGDAPRSPQKGGLTRKDAGQGVERVTGIEPALSAWEADVLPLNYTREPSQSNQRQGQRAASSQRLRQPAGRALRPY